MRSDGQQARDWPPPDRRRARPTNVGGAPEALSRGRQAFADALDLRLPRTEGLPRFAFHGW